MRFETAAYKGQRQRYVTAPQLFLRPYFVRRAGDGTEWPFARDFASHPVLSPETPKLICVQAVKGNTQTVDPIASVSSIGFLTSTLVDVRGEITRHMADPALPLTEDLDDSTDPIDIPVDGDLTGYPSRGHIQIGVEDFQYDEIDHDEGVFVECNRAARGTDAIPHTAGALVRNGEQIRRGTRMALHLGYAPLTEEFYGPGPGYTKMEVVSVASGDDGLSWQIGCQDVQRFVKRKVFETATSQTPTVLRGHPINLALRVLLSTGTGFNGVYDVLPKVDGAGAPESAIDIVGLERIRDIGFPGLVFEFREVESQDAKRWVEEQIFRPLQLVPKITQRGRYGAGAMRQPLFARSGMMSGALRPA